MREKKNFAERTRISKEDRTRKKYFLVFEGNRTEGIYFNTINELKDKIGINPLIEIISIEKTYTEEGWSNPKKILEQLLKDLEEIENGKFSYKTLVDKIIEIIMEDKKFFSNISKEISLKEIIEDIKNEIESLDNIVENVEEDCEFLLNMIIKKLFLTIEEIPNILETVLKAPISTLAILTYITAWNDYFWPLLVSYTDSSRVLMVALAVFRSQASQTGPDWSGLMAATLVAALPMLLLFMAFARRIVNSIDFTGIK